MFLPPARELLKLPRNPTVVEYVMLGTVFAFLVLSIFAIKPFLYDVFVVVTKDQIRIRGGAPVFLETVIAVNPGNVAAP
jgi:hypothetical protein